MWQTLINWDRQLFLLINGCHAPFFDGLMSFFSATVYWTPMFLLLLWFLFRHYGLKKTAYLLLFTAVLICITDRTSVVLFKELFHRLRPCHQADLENYIHLVNGHCGGQYGFISSHACNHFGFLSFLFPFLYKKNRIIACSLTFWVVLVAYSRIYLGVHFPADVAVGALVGLLLGCFTYYLFQKFEDKMLVKNPNFWKGKA